MSLKIKDIGTKYILDWDESNSFLKLSTFDLSTWNQSNQDYDVTLQSIKKIGSCDFVDMFDVSTRFVTTVLTIDEFYLLNTTTTSTLSKGFTHTNNKITKLGESYGPIKIEGNLSISSGDNNDIYVSIFKNGSIVSSSEQVLSTNNVGDTGSCSFSCLINLLDTDFIQVYVRNSTSTSNITLNRLSVILTELV
jgi:hypothetical protein